MDAIEITIGGLFVGSSCEDSRTIPVAAYFFLWMG